MPESEGSPQQPCPYDLPMVDRLTQLSPSGTTDWCADTLGQLVHPERLNGVKRRQTIETNGR
jgi:hypothetical protein